MNCYLCTYLIGTYTYTLIWFAVFGVYKQLTIINNILILAGYNIKLLCFYKTTITTILYEYNIPFSVIGDRK